MNILNVLTFLSYIALNLDILLQLKKVYTTKSAHDLSLLGLGIRYIAILVIMFKFVSLSDLPLILGQGLIVITFTAYLTLAVSCVLRTKKNF